MSGSIPFSLILSPLGPSQYELVYLTIAPLDNISVSWTVPFPNDLIPTTLALRLSLRAKVRTSEADALYPLINIAILLNFLYTPFLASYFVIFEFLSFSW